MFTIGITRASKPICANYLTEQVAIIAAFGDETLSNFNLITRKFSRRVISESDSP